MADVFISYSSVDRTIADAVCASLESNGVSCWIAPRDIPAGSYAAAIVKAINDSRLMVLVFSSSSNKSPQVEREIERAVSKNKVIYPLRIENVLPSPDLELFISSEQWMDAFERPIEPRLEIFSRNVKQLLSATPASVESVPAPDKPVLPAVPAPEPPGIPQLRASFWNGAAVFLLMCGLGATVNTSVTLLAAAPHTVIFVCVAVCVLLFLLSASTLLRRGRLWLKKVFALFRIDRELNGASRAWFLLGMLAILIVLRLLLPELTGRYFKYKGARALSNKQFTQAIENYERANALGLEPAASGLANAHFGLAVQYDKARAYPAAVVEYEHVLAYAPASYAANNNLARVYILLGDPNRALAILNRLQKDLASLPVSVQYFLYKNLGWANLELHNYRTAEDQLTWALVKQDGSAAQYLLGRLYDEQGRAVEAKAEWNNFVRSLQNRSEAEEEVEPDWIAKVQDKLHER